MVYKNWLYMHENIDYSFLWTTLTFVEPTRLTDIIILLCNKLKMVKKS